MTEATTAQDELLTTKRGAQLLGISRRHLYTLISAGEIATIRIPSTTGAEGEHRIEPSELEAFKARHRFQASA